MNSVELKGTWIKLVYVRYFHKRPLWYFRADPFAELKESILKELSVLKYCKRIDTPFCNSSVYGQTQINRFANM